MFYTTGFFEGTADFDPGLGVFNLTALGFNDIYVLKLDSAGNFTWALSIGAVDGFCTGASIFIDPAGRNAIYLTGGFSGTADFDPGPDEYYLTSSGSNDIFVLKLDTSGGFVWAVGMGGGGNDFAYAITIDPSGNVYTTGRFFEVADFDPGTNVFNLISAGYDDVFVSKLNDAGEFQWAKAMGGDQSEEGFSIALDADNNVYTNGYFYGTADFDPGPGSFNLTSLGLDNGFISKLSSSGDLLWAKGIIGTERASAGSINVNTQSGDVYMAGGFIGTIDFDPGIDSFNLTASGADWNLFILKLDATGNFDWVKTMYSTYGIVVGIIQLSSDFNFIYVAGSFSETVDFDPGEGVYDLTADGQDVYAVRLDSEGNFLWAVRPIGDGNESVGALALDQYCNVHIAGGFIASAFIFGADTLSSDYFDAFIAKLKGCPGVVTNPGDSGEGSLRDIISCSPSGTNIGFNLQPTSQITLTTGEIIIEKNVTLSGTGVLDLAISGNNTSRIFQVLPGRSLTISDMVLKDGAADSNGGAIYTKGSLTLENVLLQNNFENGIPKSMTLMSPGSLMIMESVIIHE